jgi:hypothetical protein
MQVSSMKRLLGTFVAIGSAALLAGCGPQGGGTEGTGVETGATPGMDAGPQDGTSPLGATNGVPPAGISGGAPASGASGRAGATPGAD